MLSPILHGPYLHSWQLKGEVALLVGYQNGDRVGYEALGGRFASSVFNFAYSDEKAWVVLTYNNEIATFFMMSVFSNSSAGDGGLNV